MRNVRFSPDVVKTLRALVRDASRGTELQAALRKIYTTGFDNGQAEATKRIKEVLDASNQSPSAGDNNDRVVIQSQGSKLGAGNRADADDSDSGEGSAEPTPETAG